MRRLAICLHIHSWACFLLSVVTFWQWFSGFVVSVLKGVLWGSVREREWVCGWLCAQLKDRSRPICVCDCKWIFGKFLCMFQLILCGLTNPNPTILSHPYPLSRSWDVSGGGNPVVALIVISIVFHWVVCYSPLYIVSCLTLFPPWAEGHDTDTTIWHTADE